MKNQKTDKRPVDVIIDEYAGFHQKPANRIINYICIPLIVFSVVGFVWSLPFPQLKFLGSYIIYLNWGSFLIAFSVYYYMRLSPILSYVMLLLLFALVYLVIQVQAAEHSGVLLPQVCVFIFIMANIAQFIGYRIEGRKPTFSEEFKFMLTSPLWLLSLVLKKFGIKY
ncbi:DUF962 domain-containing protein [Mucilaginibacter sp. UR6-11]|uniref:Mpo1 family 2-hydroxy fatty acid dioxygenase n=1 Tax=Mucilaginibacter sp. UR6-11 TaxID=1435644 RepID=UPI001E2D510E|nr:Mpo1-like protein [Mucilaginibacter sp. UR6-11]MCC8424010.1 DUF962 domain-containing protein [Mucilaginibacter sp. UR6-11]